MHLKLTEFGASTLHASQAEAMLQGIQDSGWHSVPELLDSMRVWALRALAAAALHMEQAQLCLVAIHLQGRRDSRAALVCESTVQSQ